MTSENFPCLDPMPNGGNDGKMRRMQEINNSLNLIDMGEERTGV